ncbi:hypothetical protein ANANG_G00145900 [Anguilla anguilla]|uniref:Uncharacterized protein n=1 Tax=Anguilla anguilla TaxID=7936 RepID=A0A9D3MBQ4_ANGAN|nr:hypothetical protein ANANG_G00145900 [Anguilla anguilla]
MMRPLFPVTLCCISLLSLQQQPLALPAGARLDRHRLNFLKRVPEAEEGETFIAGTLPSPGASLGPAREEAGRDWWKPPPRQSAPLRRATEAPAQNETPLHRADAGRPAEGAEGATPRPRQGEGPPPPPPPAADARGLRPGHLPGAEPQSPPLPADWPERAGRHLPHEPQESAQLRMSPENEEEEEEEEEASSRKSRRKKKKNSATI